MMSTLSDIIKGDTEAGFLLELSYYQGSQECKSLSFQEICDLFPGKYVIFSQVNLCFYSGKTNIYIVVVSCVVVAVLPSSKQ